MGDEETWESYDCPPFDLACQSVPMVRELPPLRPASVKDLRELFNGLPNTEGDGPRSLQTLCTTVLALYIDEYVSQLGHAGLAWLPAECKALIITINRCCVYRYAMHACTAYRHYLWSYCPRIQTQARMPPPPRPPTPTSTPSTTLLRRRRSLHDAVLLALADPALTVLDLWGCGSMLSDQAIRDATRNMPNLQVSRLHFS